MRHLEIRPGVYRDSVALMRISASLTAIPGVERALVAMATPVNIDLLAAMGFDSPSASPNDLMVAVVTSDEEALVRALERLEADLSAPAATPSTSEVAEPPRTTASAARRVGRGIALVSTPGPYAFVEAMDALDAGLSVMVFSDNVPVEQEVRLKRCAAERGLLVMGPDCGTAVLAGVGLGFANVVRPGPVGLVSASGTGAQQVMALLAAAGVGISHCLGVGGRDLSDVVGGVSTHAALDALDADPETETIVVLGKPPSPRVADEVRSHAALLATPTMVSALGPDAPDLTAVVCDLLARLGVAVPPWPSWARQRDGEAPWPMAPAPATDGGCLLGLYGGGTLCVEAQAIVSALLGPVRSNVPLRPQWLVGPSPQGHTLLDLGADEYTIGRPHPMLDPAARSPLLKGAADDGAGVVLLDVVLGHGSHPDPAAVLAPTIAEAGCPVVVALIGTPDDPQGLTRQAEALAGAGASVHLSNAEAARHAAGIVSAAERSREVDQARQTRADRGGAGS